jgi:hypothetical protein
MNDWNPNLPMMPVDKDGNWLDYPHGYPRVDHWEPVHQPFWAVMRIDGMRTGRSSKKVILEDIKTKRRYPMFVADLVKSIQNGLVDVKSADGDGYLTALWTGSKRGANYGIKAVK